MDKDYYKKMKEQWEKQSPRVVSDNKRNKIITDDDLINLRIILETSRDVKDILEKV